MSDIDNKLRDILGEYGTAALLTTTEGFPSREPYIKKIKEAFKADIKVAPRKIVCQKCGSLVATTSLMTGQEWKEELKQLLLEYSEYEEDLVEKQVIEGGPRPVNAHFSFSRFFNWLFGLRQP